MFQPQNGIYCVETPEVAALFRSPLEIKRLGHFMRPGGISTTEFARMSGLSVNAAYRKVQRLLAQGLVSQVAEEKRAGRPMRRYACTYRQFFIPARLTSIYEQVSDVFEPMLRLMQSSVVDTLTTGKNPVGGMIFALDERGLWLLPATPAGERWRHRSSDPVAAVNDSGPLRLDHDDALALAAELHELFDRYRQKRGNTLYLLHQLLTPARTSGEYAYPHAGYTELI